MLFFQRNVEKHNNVEKNNMSEPLGEDDLLPPSDNEAFNGKVKGSEIPGLRPGQVVGGRSKPGGVTSLIAKPPDLGSGIDGHHTHARASEGAKHQ